MQWNWPCETGEKYDVPWKSYRRMPKWQGRCAIEQRLIKYPSTKHLPWSPGVSREDKVLKDTKHFEGRMVVVTEKMDGENTTMGKDFIHARSLSSGTHPSRTWVNTLHAEIKHEIPTNLRICGENLFAKHSIFYPQLTSYFQVFSIWEENTCLSWQDTEEFCQLLGLKTVPVLLGNRAVSFNEDFFRFPANILTYRVEYTLTGYDMEGYVIRNKDSFAFEDFDKNVAKFVRANHVQTDEHWMTQQIVKNQLCSY